MGSDGVLLRSAQASDQDWLFGTYKATLKPCVEWAWGWDEIFQREDTAPTSSGSYYAFS